MKKKILFSSLGILVGLAIGLLISVNLNIFSLAQSQEVKQIKEPEKLSLTAVAVKNDSFNLENAVTNVASTAGRAVVSISTEHTTKIKGSKRYRFSQPYENSPFSENDQFRKFFDDFFGDMPDREYKQRGLGSGVIIDPQGFILTNEHVIDGADKMTVTLPDGREFKGELKGKDERSDLAIIKISATNLPAVSLGDSDNIKIGQWVVAIGNPFGFSAQNPEPTVTVGVISALHRSLGRMLAQDRDYNDLIQTDAAINPGNSGGPLVNLKGEVIGINVAIFSTTGGYQGVGFAIPISNAKRIISRLIEGKKIAYGWLGVTVQNITDDLAKYFGLTDKNGVLVAKVLDNAPAAKAGIKEKDIIKQFEGKPINSVKELLGAVGKTEIGRKVKLVLIRDKKEVTVEVQIGERPQDLESAEEETELIKPEVWRGLEVKFIENKGIVISDIKAGSLSEDAGLVVGDVILQINNQNIKNMADYDKAIKSVKGNCLIKTSRGFFLIKSETK